MARTSCRLPWAVAVFAVAAAGVVAAVAWTRMQERDAHIAALQGQVADLRGQLTSAESARDGVVDELEAALRIGERLSARVDALESDLAEAQQTRLDVREVRGTADFPILRAMARSGDTVAAFAAREGTTEAVVRALNPWLDGATDLDGWQTLWIPKPRE